jgi:4-amino-4-deoxy-L-arabinose transferase-like glycosyltransferase
MTATLTRAPETVDTTGPVPPQPGRARRLVRGPVKQPGWVRPALLTLLALTGVLYLWDLSASGYANSFYAAATQAGSQSLKAWFFGSLDSGNSITVDKPPASLWVTGLSARIFGLNTWSLLVPQALEGVASVGLLYGAVRRVAGPRAGLFAGAALALTPAAVLMFRFDNPDALLTLLLLAAGYALTRSLEQASAKWLALSGSALGFAFLTKMLQGWLVLPAFAAVYLFAAPTRLRRRIGHVALAGLSMIVSAGWWVAVVALWPASSRPYIGGSTNNSVLDLVFGYNGLGRLLGVDGTNGGGATANSAFGGPTGLARLFTSEMGNEISWLLPAALVALVAGLVLRRGTPRTDRTRAALLLWGGWLVVTGLVFSYMKGTIHPYYTVVLAPPIAALVAIGASELWRARARVAARLGLAALALTAGGWSYLLLNRAPSWHPELRYLLLAATVVTMVAVLVPPQRGRVAARGAVVAGIATALIGVGSFGVATAASPHTGSIPSVGPAAAQTSGMGGMGGMGSGSANAPGGSSRSTSRPASGSAGAAATGSGSASTSAASSSSSATAGAGGGAAMGGTTTSAALVTALKATSSTWAAAVAGDQSAAELELATGKAVIAIGGWSGSDNSPTLAQFKAYVAAGQIRYYIASGQGGGQGGQSGAASQIASWVKAHYTAKTIGGVTVYDLSASTS